MDGKQWPSAERVLAIADAAEELRKAIWIGWRTSDPKSPGNLPGFRVADGEIHRWLAYLDALFHGRSIKMAQEFSDGGLRYRMFLTRCSERNISPAEDGIGSRCLMANWRWSETARPGDEESPAFYQRIEKAELVIALGSPTYLWLQPVEDRYLALWRVFAGLKLYFGFGEVAYSLYAWEQPRTDCKNPWHAAERYVRTVQQGIETPPRPTLVIGPENQVTPDSNHILDSRWLDALEINACGLRESVQKDTAGHDTTPQASKSPPPAVPAVLQREEPATLTDLLTTDDLATLAMVERKTFHNRLSKSRQATNQATRPPTAVAGDGNQADKYSYAAIRPWLCEQWAVKAFRFPESFAEVKRFLAAQA